MRTRWRASALYVDGKLSWRALQAITLRLDICYTCIEGTEESLIEDLRAFVRFKPTIDLRTVVGKFCRCRRAEFKAKRAADIESPEILPVHILEPHASATAPTGVVLHHAR